MQRPSGIMNLPCTALGANGSSLRIQSYLSFIGCRFILTSIKCAYHLALRSVGLDSVDIRKHTVMP